MIGTLSVRYPELQSMNENQVMSLFSIARSNESHNIYSDLISERGATANDCDVQFEAAFHRIHASYDTGVEWCLYIGLATPWQWLLSV